MKRIRVQVPATITNVGPGLNTIGIAVKYYNYITIEDASEPGVAIANLNEAEKLSAVEVNHFKKIVCDFWSKIPFEPPTGIKIINDFRIPLNRGLNSMAAGVMGLLLAASQYAELELKPDEILNVFEHYQIGHHNFCASIFGGFVIAVKADRGIVVHKIPFDSELNITLIIPDYEVSGSKMQQLLPKNVSMEDAVFNVGRTALFVASVCSGNFKALNVSMEDKLHQPYRRRLLPAADAISLISKTCDSMGVSLCGDGASLLILHKNNCEATIKKIKNAYLRHKIPVELIHSEIDEMGISLI